MAYLILENDRQKTAFPEGGFFDFDPDNHHALESIRSLLAARYGKGKKDAPVTLLSASSDEGTSSRCGITSMLIDLLKHRRKKPPVRTSHVHRPFKKNTVSLRLSGYSIT